MSFRGVNNPNWKGGLIEKSCEQCGRQYFVKPGYTGSRFCSMTCCNRGKSYSIRTRIEKACRRCGAIFSVQPSRLTREVFCSEACHSAWRSVRMGGESNPNWTGGLSRLPYRYNWRDMSAAIRDRDGHQCHGLDCRKEDRRLVVHHIDYDKQNCDPMNLLTLCSSCNTRANFDRPRWKRGYQRLMQRTAERYPLFLKAWDTEEF